MKLKNLLLLLVLATLWGPSFLFIKIAIVEISPITLAALRIGLAAILLHIWLFIKGYEFNRSWTFWKHVTVAGFFAQALPFALINWGEQYIDSSIASILNGLTPLATVVIANFAIADERMTVERIVGTTLGFIGLLVLVSPNLVSGADASVLGIVAVAIAAVSYGVGLVYSRLYLIKEKPLYAPSSQLLVAAAYLIPFALLVEGPVAWATLSWGAIGSLLVLGTFGTALAFVIYYKILTSASASYLSLVTYLMPIYGVALGIIFLDEILAVEAIIGAVLILLGIMIANQTIKIPTGRKGSPKVV
ncbi:DMT family transporter [Reichenbachiella carrageenanivorans]|uniref:DMT family transporter n=1 Tax=Reichenbachiella carrageenanivorans TaxID=2979869 RepID=A0ABY6D260_9BACT|nr:DMT family transporter [Reichenbachiella carrageenanivorans]UXX80249.1 DMT family transporter [Reichenbachiella carrageenanivorans]